MSYGKQFPGSEIQELEEEEKPPIPEGENHCASCAAAPLCHVRIAISTIAPEGGIEIGACGFYLPATEEEPK